MSHETPTQPVTEQILADEATSLGYWLAEQMGEHVDDQDDETLTETVQRYVSREWMPKTAALATPRPRQGVWIIWASHSRTDGFHAVFPGDQEIDALRYVNESGYGRAEFTEYGELKP